ncbi:IclR family transcriptional regulator [Ilumatobacter sp.]|uniref:IclR family transcriptional regulator n=1 Tax=Ilumatobacter sp. TaxID=1967498 RepID=UPI003AF6DAB0
MPSEPHAADSETVPRSIGRVLDLLEIVLGEPRNLTAAAQAAGLTPTTALRHLRALEARGYVRRDDANTYAAGPTIRRLAAALRDGGPLDRLIAAAQPRLDELALATGESAYLAIGDGRVATYVARAESERAIRHVGWIGQTVTLEGTAVGAAFHTPGRCVTRTGAVEPDITAISFGLPPIGPLAAAISLIGPSHRLDTATQARHESALTTAATELAFGLGLHHDEELAS